ncbi:MAG: N-6 DNA methylase [Snowella sp.]|nr:N-6 DNA methylase [Snowella sp.]
MANQLQPSSVLEITTKAWHEPKRKIRMPDIDNTKKPVVIDALWTDYELRPNAGVLAFLIQPVTDQKNLELWKKRVEEWPIRGGLLVSPDETLHLVEPTSDSSQTLGYKVLSIDDWRETLASPKPHLFTPKALSQFRRGQLSLADIEETIDKRSFSFILRQQQQIDQAFENAIKAALKKVNTTKNLSSSRKNVKGHIVRVAIAYLAARILEDKGFFGADEVPQADDPLNSLQRMVEHTNGFFSRALESAEFVNEVIRQQLAVYMGPSVSFTLTNHRDVGRLYEKAVIKLPDDLEDQIWGDLNRHYTPIKVAEKILELLPLERIRPEERFIFDPAAGSGSLLLAATLRLSQMSDIPYDQTLRREYLSNHVIGNDLDEDVKLITQLRYFLASEAVNISDLLPSPQFYNENYESFNRDNISQKIGNKPKIIVANPPFDIIGDKQLAFEFIKNAIGWLDDGSQFAFILPSSFLSEKKFGALDTRKLLSQKCDLFEVWQFPVGTIGINARQDVCVITGSVGQIQNKHFTVSKSVVSGAEISAIQDDGYLGNSWITNINPNGDLIPLATNGIKPVNPMIVLGKLFFVFTGVLPRKGHPRIEHPLSDRPCKLTWRMRWAKKGSLWADPSLDVDLEDADRKLRWVIYDNIALESPRKQVQHLFDKPKILVGRIANIASSKSLSVQLDTTGFCPNNSIWCILPIQEAEKTNKGYQQNLKPENWEKLGFEKQRLWLLGILASNLAVELSMPGRGTVNLAKDILLKFPLPLYVDPKIIDITAQMVKRDQNREPIPENDPLRKELNRLVEKSYGNPTFIKRQRTGKSPELKAWQNEQEKPTKMAIGQVLEISENQSEVRMYISRLMDDDETEGEWIPLPQELPGWALDGTPFEVQLSKDIKTFEQLRERPWALRKFVHEPRAYLTNEELEEFLRIPELELPL